MKKYVLAMFAALMILSMPAGCAGKNEVSAAYEKLIAYKTNYYSKQSVADFNNSLRNEDLTELYEAYDTVMTDISSDDENYDFITLTLATSLNEIYHEQVGKNTAFSISGYLERKEQPFDIELLPDEENISAKEQIYEYILYGLYNINYTISDPAELTVAERDSALQTFRTEMQTYVDGLSENEIVGRNIKTRLSDKAAELAKRISTDRIQLSYEISNIELSDF